MKMLPIFQDPDSVLVFQSPLPDQITWETFRQAGAAALAALQIELEGEKVILKPNLTSGERFADPDTGITTHPGFLHGMIDYLQGHGARRGLITIAEDPRDSDDNHPRHWRNTGFDRLAQETGARLYCPTTYTCVKKTVPAPLAFARLNVARPAVAPNTVLFNVPKLKNHNLAITTLGMKNLMGLVNVFDRHFCLQAWEELPEAIRANPHSRREWFTREMHEAWQSGLARRLIDTAQVVRPTLNIIEGIVGREGTGFQRGRNRKLGLSIAGSNIVAVDSVASYLMGFEPSEIVYLRMASEAGLGSAQIEKLRIYTASEDQAPTLRREPAALRVSPPFHVITNTLGEAPDPFQDESLGVIDPSDTFFGKSKS